MTDCYAVNLPISVSIGRECVKGRCQDTIASLWVCNVRPSIGTRRTMVALEGENITTVLNSLSALPSEYREEQRSKKNKSMTHWASVSMWLIPCLIIAPGEKILSIWEYTCVEYVGHRVIKLVDFNLTDCTVGATYTRHKKDLSSTGVGRHTSKDCLITFLDIIIYYVMLFDFPSLTIVFLWCGVSLWILCS